VHSKNVTVKRPRGTETGPITSYLRWVTLDRVAIILVPFMFYSGSTGTLHIAVLDFLFPVLAILAFAKPATERMSGALRPLVLFSALLVSIVANSALSVSLSDPDFNAGLAVKNAFKLVVVVLYAVVFAIRASGMDRDELFDLLRTWGWTATGVSLASIITAAGVAHIVPTDDTGDRSFGFFQDPNLYAGYLLLSLSVVLAAEVMRPSSWTLVQLLCIVAGVVLTASRGAMASIALLSVLALVFIASWKTRMIIASIGVSGASLLYLLGSGRFGPLLRPAFDRLDSSGRQIGEDPRMRLWARAISLWNEHPLFGVGIGQFGRFTIDVNGYDEDDVGQIAHNTFLSFLVETGIFGLLLCIAGMAFLVFRIYRDQRLEIRLRHAFSLGVVAICSEMLTLNLQNVRYVWVFVGLIWGFTVGKSQLSRVADTVKRSMLPSDSSTEVSTRTNSSAAR
jgi:O-antigen ligase